MRKDYTLTPKPAIAPPRLKLIATAIANDRFSASNPLVKSYYQYQGL
ncbi:MAG: hypothetical protein HC851_17200 [Acaryochloris sp. RU_4_1]|nr:hypothetical protein [Acaryochloris sp. RU_4_1]NJN38387.1 hypothetical protein [Acaryochloridaceae cyanobacterium CSU_3_4]NJR57076.1 hypothetical protein [Acaryochloris sp. CRU_2_0]